MIPSFPQEHPPLIKLVDRQLLAHSWYLAMVAFETANGESFTVDFFRNTRIIFIAVCAKAMKKNKYLSLVDNYELQ